MTNATTQSKEKELRVWVGIVSHRHGYDAYVGVTEEDLYEKLYAYALQWWSEVDSLPAIEGFASKREAVDAYFERHGSEWLQTAPGTLDADLVRRALREA